LLVVRELKVVNETDVAVSSDHETVWPLRDTSSKFKMMLMVWPDHQNPNAETLAAAAASGASARAVGRREKAWESHDVVLFSHSRATKWSHATFWKASYTATCFIRVS
jgi:hypothetical protein